jgi:tetratricopeptide (TPR) repeat protein
MSDRRHSRVAGSAVVAALSLLICAQAVHADWGKSFDQGELLYGQGDKAGAEKLFDQALKEAEAFGENDGRLAATLNDLAVIYDETKRFDQGEKYYKRALAIRERAFGKSSDDVATTLNNLANLYKDRGSYAQAEPLYNRAVQIYSEKKNQPLLAMSYNNLASLMVKENKPEQAIQFYSKSLAAADASLGPTNHHTLDILVRLADLYRKQGQIAKAKPLYKRYLDQVLVEFKLNAKDPKTPIRLRAVAKGMRSDGMSGNADAIEQAVSMIYPPAQK